MLKNKNNLSLKLTMCKKNRHGFSLIELIVVIAIIGTLVMLGTPKFMNRISEAKFAKHIANAKTLEDASDRFHINNDRFPRLSEEHYTHEEIETYAKRIFDLTGQEVALNPEGKYYDIDYIALKDYVNVPDKNDRPHYILQNPVGKVFVIDELTEIAKERVDFTVSNPMNNTNKPGLNNQFVGFSNSEAMELLEKGYVLATDSDFSGEADGKFKYIGTDEYIVIPNIIKNINVTSYYSMFTSTSVKGVASSNANVTDMRHTFENSIISELKYFNTSSVKNMSGMFSRTKDLDKLDLIFLDTSNVEDMSYMFNNNSTKTIDLSSFNTSKVTTMRSMFRNNSITNLNLLNFDTSNVTDMSHMFEGSKEAPNLSSFNTSKVENMSFMFWSNKAEEINLSFRDNVSTTSMAGMFKHTKAKKITLSSFNNSKVIDMSSMFEGADAEIIHFRNFNTSNVVSMRDMFNSNKGSQVIGLDSFNTSNVTDMRSMFQRSKIKNLNLSSFNTSKVKNMRTMFSQSDILSINFSRNFKTHNVTDMHAMFVTSKVDTLDLSSFEVSSNTNINYMFNLAETKRVYVSSWSNLNRLNESTPKPPTLKFTIR